MKKTFFGGFAALSLIAVIASGCARETVESKNDKQIKFTTVVGKQTRATEFTYWEPSDMIEVHSFPAGSAAPFRHFNLMYNGGGPTDWVYSPAVPQPGVPLVFFSIYPLGSPNVSNENLTGIPGLATFDYEVPIDDTDQVDLIAAFAETSDHMVGLQFEHLLSQVNFGIRGLEGIQYEVTNITLSGLADNGTYTFGGAWNVQGDETFPYRSQDGVYVTPGDVDEILFLGNNPGNYSNDNALMLLPQNLSGATLSFDYAVYDRDSNPIQGASGSMGVPLGGLNGVSAWMPSIRYVYVFDFTGDNIVFTVDVMPWVDYDQNGGLIPVTPY